jgi:hypothetical protein
MNLNGFLKLGEGVINEKFMMWGEMAGTARVNVGFKVRMVREESNNFSSDEDVYIIIVIRREFRIDTGNVRCSML